MNHLRSAPRLFKSAPSAWPSVWAEPRHARTFAVTASHPADYAHAVIGAGVVGLAIAARLAQHGGNVLLLEKNDAVGMETSARNSEVIHAGLYYGEDSLKTKLCIRGKIMMYERCQKYGIPHKQVGKWVVAQTDGQREALEKIHAFSKIVDVPTSFVSPEDAARLEPHVQAVTGVLESPTTGIVDSHAFMQHLLAVAEEHGTDLALNARVTSITAQGQNGTGGWEIEALDAATGESITITADTLINAAGHGACAINNLIVPPERHVTPFYAKGNYFSYGSATPKTSRLIYPAPEPGLGGLGTHLTLDMAGRLRFGPDVEWIDNPSDLTVNAARLPEAITAIKQYLPGVDADAIAPDYAGIRPKLGRSSVSSGKGFQDFIIRAEDGYTGFINLLGIESPGLTSSLAIAEEVFDIVYGRPASV